MDPDSREAIAREPLGYGGSAIGCLVITAWGAAIPAAIVWVAFDVSWLKALAGCVASMLVVSGGAMLARLK